MNEIKYKHAQNLIPIFSRSALLEQWPTFFFIIKNVYESDYFNHSCNVHLDDARTKALTTTLVAQTTRIFWMRALGRQFLLSLEKYEDFVRCTQVVSALLDFVSRIAWVNITTIILIMNSSVCFIWLQ